MQKNVGGYDRLARLVLGPVLVVVGLAGYVGLVTLAFGPFPQALTSIVVFLVGLVLAVTGTIQKCPANSLLGVNTYRRREEAEVPETEAPETEAAATEEMRTGGSD